MSPSSDSDSSSFEPPATTQAVVNMATNTDVEMHEDQSLCVTAVGGSRTTPPPLATSEVSSPAAVEDSVMHKEGGQQHMGIGLGGVEVVEGGHVGEAAPPGDDQADPYTENQDHAADHLLDRIPEPYGTPEPRVPFTTGERVETMLDTLIGWFDTQDILLPVERAYLARLKNVMLDYNSTGIVDRSRYS